MNSAVLPVPADSPLFPAPGARPLQLFSFPFSCALAVRMVLLQHGVPHELVTVDRGPARQATGGGLEARNPKRKVPTVVLPSGEVLTEIVAVMMFLDSGLGERGPAEQRALLRWLCFLSSELHQAVLGPLYDPATPAATRDDVRARLLPPVLAHLDQALAAGPFLLQGGPSPADAYLLWGLLLLRNDDPAWVATPGLRQCLRTLGREPWARQALREEQALREAQALREDPALRARASA